MLEFFSTETTRKEKKRGGKTQGGRGLKPDRGLLKPMALTTELTRLKAARKLRWYDHRCVSGKRVLNGGLGSSGRRLNNRRERDFEGSSTEKRKSECELNARPHERVCECVNVTTTQECREASENHRRDFDSSRMERK